MKTNGVATLNALKVKSPIPIGHLRGVCILTVFFLLFSSCSSNDDTGIDNSSLPTSEEINFKNQSPATILAWNDALESHYTFALGGPGTSPVATSYVWGLVHLAMHDALNCITPRYETFIGVPRDKEADPDAAVSQAAYDVIMAVNTLPFAPAYLPQNLGNITALHNSILGGIPNGPAKNRGIALGHAVAQAIMASRAGDLPNLAPASPNQPLEGTEPGEYRYLPFPPAPNGLGHAFPNYGNLKPFFMTENDQFRPGSPYEVSSPEYAADYNEIKDFGGAISPSRTPDQTEFGVFWAENTNRGWNQVARKVLATFNPQSQNAWKVARYLALVHVAIADAYISVFNSKLYYYTWRPIHAIHLADSDGNPTTTADPSWAPLLVTPPIGEYPSAHALTGAAAGRIIYRHFDNRDNYNLSLDSGYLPGVTRSFNKLSDAIRENSLSRIYIGFHFRQAVDVGEAKGMELADFVFENALQ